MSLTFDRFRAEMEQKNQDPDATPEVYDEDVFDLAEAARRMIKRKVEPMNAESQQNVMGLLKQCASDMFGSNDGTRSKSVIDVNVTNVKGNNKKEALILSVEMTSKSGSMNQLRGNKRPKRQVKMQGNKTKMTITAVLEQSTSTGTNQQVTITKGKSGSVSISGVSIQQSKNETNETKSDTSSGETAEESLTTSDGSSNKNAKGK